VRVAALPPCRSPVRPLVRRARASALCVGLPCRSPSATDLNVWALSEEAEPGWGIGLRLDPTPLAAEEREPPCPGSGSTDAPEIPAAAALGAAQTMTATPPAIAAARAVRARIQAGGTSLLSTAQPAKSRAPALPLVTVQSSSEDRPAFPIGVDPSLPRFLRFAQLLFRAGPCDGRASAGRSGYTPQGNFLPLSPYP
jgi:hypothetical protein